MKPEGGRLLLKAARAIRAAELLLREGDPDFASARAYYAMFYAAEALLFERGLQFRKHGAVHGLPRRIAQDIGAAAVRRTALPKRSP